MPLSAPGGPFQAGASYLANDNVANTVPSVTKGIYVGTTGNLAVRWAANQSNTTFVAIPAGTVLSIRVDKIWTTGTTASNFVVLY